MGRSYYYRQDPKWLAARYAGTCEQCEAAIPKGAQAFYYPKGKHIFCEPCGRPRSEEFEAAASAEYYGNGLVY